MPPARKAILLAAGKSTRISSVFHDRPKPLIPVAGEPVLARNLRWLVAEGVVDIWINLHHLGDQIKSVVGDGAAYGAQVRYSLEQQLLGTAGAVRKLRDEWTQPFWVVYGDNLLSFSLDAMQALHVSGQFALTMAVFDCQRHISTGVAGGLVVVEACGRVLQFVEGQTDISPYVNAGVYLVEPHVVDDIPAGAAVDFGHDVFPRMLAQRSRLGAHVIDGYCLGIDTPAAYSRLTELVRSNQIVLA